MAYRTAAHPGVSAGDGRRPDEDVAQDAIALAQRVIDTLEHLDTERHLGATHVPIARVVAMLTGHQ